MVPLTSGTVIAYSKTETDNLPITSTALAATQPCMNPTESEATTATSFYPTELDRRTSVCRAENGNSYDPRYSEVGEEVSEYDLQSASGVLSILQGYPIANQYLDIEQKKNQKYSLWTRPTIEWKLKCESDDGRARLLDSLHTTLIATDPETINTTKASVIFACALICTFLTIMMCCFGVPAIEEVPSTLPALGCFVAIQLALIVPCIFMAKTMLSNFTTAQDLIGSLAEQLSGCSDEYTNVDLARYNAEFGGVESSAQAVVTLGKVIVYCDAAILVCAIIYVLASYNHYWESDKEEVERGEAMKLREAE